MRITKKDGKVYEVRQLDRDYFELSGPGVHQVRVNGWKDALNLVEGGF